MVYIMKELKADMQIVMKLCDYFKVTPNEFLELKKRGGLNYATCKAARFTN